MAALTKSIEYFDPKTHSFGSYVKRLEHMFVCNEVPDNRKLSYCITLIGPVAYQTLEDLVSPEELNHFTYEQVIEMLQSHYAPVTLVIAERFKFKNLRQTEEELVADFVVRLRSAARNCKFDKFLDDALRHKLICGLAKEEHQKKLLAKGDSLTTNKEIKKLQLTSSGGTVEVNKVTKVRKSCLRCGR
ncbi:hypothetical protein RN001_000359 [Aquatica leii]|uniref:Retrotransposon gag domain-containing protein n=1 Tax=Aquatica leii TaxID=1421715 RepID=A0AAN7QM00_9COLE|nr:hypothetical protein RN001_000359 [Aquatica leii]